MWSHLSDEEFLQRAVAMCPTKAAYVTRAEAATLLRRKGFPGTPYKCPNCEFWHTTTFDKRETRVFSRRLSRALRSLQESA